MHRKGLRATVGGVDIDVPVGAWAAGEFLRYNASTGVIDSAAAGGGGGGNVVGTPPTVVGNVSMWNNTLATALIDSGLPSSQIPRFTSVPTAGRVLFVVSTSPITLGFSGIYTSSNLAYNTVGSSTAGNLVSYASGGATLQQDSSIAAANVVTAGANYAAAGNIITAAGTTKVVQDSGIAITSLKPSLVCRKTASQTLTTLANVTDMVLAIPSAGTWYFEFSFFSQNSTTTATSTFAVTFSGTQTALSAGMLHALSASTVGSVVTTTGAVSLATAARSLSAVNMVTTITGTIVATSAGNLQLQFSSSVATFTIQANGGGFAQRA